MKNAKKLFALFAFFAAITFSTANAQQKVSVQSTPGKAGSYEISFPAITAAMAENIKNMGPDGDKTFSSVSVNTETNVVAVKVSSPEWNAEKLEELFMEFISENENTIPEIPLSEQLKK